MGETVYQLQRRAKEKSKRKESVKKAPFVGHVDSVDYPNELLSIITPMPTRQIEYKHPFVGVNSWIRCSPEVGVKPLIVYRSDRFKPAVLTYEQEKNDVRIKAFSESRGVYRPLRPGEHEISSKGLAQTYWSERAIYEARAGVARRWLNQDELEAGQKAPIHVKQGINNVAGVLGDETRFGVVKRFTSAVKSKYIKIKDRFAKESLSLLTNTDSQPLVFKREGNVIDDDGIEELHGTTAKPLRAKYSFFTEDLEQLDIEIDEIGNLEMRLPNSATEGVVIKIPKGGWDMQIEEDFKLLGNKSFKGILTKDFIINAGQGTIAKFKMSKGKVALGNDQAELLDLLDQTLSLLQTDTYVGFGQLSNGAILSQYEAIRQKLLLIKGNL